MFQKVQQNKWLRLEMGLFGCVLLAAAINLFIVPQGLYSGGLYGLCQVIRTLVVTNIGVKMPFDLAGVLYLLVNIPMLWLAWRTLGSQFVVRLALGTVVNSLALAVIPSPAAPIIADKLTSCLVGGILAGFSSGLILTCGCSTGGLDILGLYLSKKGSAFTVGRFSITFNAALYALCAVLFDLSTAIYSVQMLIFTKEDPERLNQTILDKLDRSFTLWEGRGGYSHDQVHVMCVCLSKYEVVSVQMALSEIDPHAFTIIQEGIRVGGNFGRHLSS